MKINKYLLRMFDVMFENILRIENVLISRFVFVYLLNLTIHVERESVML